MSDEKLTKALRLVLRDKKYEEVSESMKKLLTDLKRKHGKAEPINVALIKDLHVHHTVMAEQRHGLLSYVQEALYQLSSRLPHNRFNIKDALEYMAHSIDPSDPESIHKAMLNAVWSLDPERDIECPAYNSSDLKDEYSRGFEEGYQKALENRKKHKPGADLDHIDLD